MMKRSAGILLYRFNKTVLQVMLVHPGGPFWAKKDTGAWSIPKGEFEEDEEPVAAAKREFEEELGSAAPVIEFTELKAVKSGSRKTVFAFAAQHDFDTVNIKSNFCTITWPPKSGRELEIPEVDKAEWFDIKVAAIKIIQYQQPLLVQLKQLVAT